MQLLTSCVDYLDKESDTELTLPMVFEDKTRTEGWLANVYSHVPDPYWGYARKLGWDILSDDMTASERWRCYWANGHLLRIGTVTIGHGCPS